MSKTVNSASNSVTPINNSGSNLTKKSINITTDINTNTNINTDINTDTDNQAHQSSLQGLVLPTDGHCFHCGDPVPTSPFYTQVLGEAREMCCMGCQLASQSIVEANLEQYYLDRSEINRTASLPTQMTQLQAYDHEDVKSQFVYAQDGLSVAELSVNNLRCAACTWLIESRLHELDGIEQCQVNLTNQRMRVIWDETQLPISEILATINRIGYDAKPYRQDTHAAMLARHNRTMMMRLGIAALGAMQAMMFAVGMYFGAYSGMLIEHRDFLRWVSLFVSIPVFFYAGFPFFTSAWAAVKARQVNMDVPVSIALTVTFFASLYATISGQGETYYDSVSMFIFFLLAGRYIEHNARLKAANMAGDLVVLEPTLIQRLGNKAEWLKQAQFVNSELSTANTDASKALDASDATDDNLLVTDAALCEQLASFAQLNDGAMAISSSNSMPFDSSDVNSGRADSAKADLQPTTVSTKELTAKITAQALQVGDVIFVEAGSEIVADGILCSDTATVSQSLLTGESDLIVKNRGDLIIGGSQNDSQPFVMLVTKLPKDSQIGLIDRLMNRAMSEKPKIAVQADMWARWFVARILLLSVVVFIGWYLVDPSKAIWATVAVLVATCPCALSLATPIALTVSTNRLATYGFLTTRGHTLQTLSNVSHIAFDKTGTLTFGKPNLLFIEPRHQSYAEDSSNNIKERESVISHENATSRESVISRENATKDNLLALAATMEVGSRHPIAHALLQAAYQLHLPVPTKVTQHPAGGIEATINNKTYRLGHFDFALTQNVAQQEHPNIPKLPERPNLQQHQASMAVVLSVFSEQPAQTLPNQQRETEESGKEGGSSGSWQALAYFYFNDKVRPQAIQMIADVKAYGITPLMLTGDPSPQALVTAKALGIEMAYNGQTPSKKVEKLQQLQAKGHVVMMVGDGINDAPVLAAANVSSAMAGATDLAQVSSDSLILNGKVHLIADAIRIANKSQHIIKQNLYWALGYNAVILLPAALGYVPPWLAAIGMSASSVLVVLNALRLKRA